MPLSMAPPSSFLKAVIMEMSSFPVVSACSPKARIFTPARTTRNKHKTDDSPGDLDGAASYALEFVFDARFSRSVA